MEAGAVYPLDKFIWHMVHSFLYVLKYSAFQFEHHPTVSCIVMNTKDSDGYDTFWRVCLAEAPPTLVDVNCDRRTWRLTAS